jgi:hypothetical protein
MTYVVTCYWIISDELTSGGFYIDIYQNYDVEIFKEAYMQVHIQSNFSHGMYIDGYLDIKDPYGNQYNIWYSTDYIDAFSELYFNVYHIFTSVGHYEVMFELVDDIGASWFAYCSWEVYADDPLTTTEPTETNTTITEPTSTTEPTTESTPPVLAGFSWTIYIGALAAFVIPVALRKRRNS